MANVFFSSVSALDNSRASLVYLDPDLCKKSVDIINHYTGFIDENTDLLTQSLGMEENEDYLIKNNSILTQESKLESKYVVQKGDTLSTIANKYGLHVATIIDKNGLKTENIEKLTMGQELTIPSKDTSSSQEWLKQINDQKEKQRQLALKQAQQKKSVASASSRSVTTRERTGNSYEGDSGGNFIVPINHNGISRGVSKGHAGIDYRVNIGTQVRGSADGKVIEITGGWGGGYGSSILIDNGGGWTTRYAHLSEVDVSLGQNISQGQTIGLSGNTGWSTGPHLHFETRINGRTVNPF